MNEQELLMQSSDSLNRLVADIREELRLRILSKYGDVYVDIAADYGLYFDDIRELGTDALIFLLLECE